MCHRLREDDGFIAIPWSLFSPRSSLNLSVWAGSLSPPTKEGRGRESWAGSLSPPTKEGSGRESWAGSLSPPTKEGRGRESWAGSLSPPTKEGRGKEGERAGLVLCLLIQRRERGRRERELGWFPVSSYKGGKGEGGRESWAGSLSPPTMEGRGREGGRELGWFYVSSYKEGKGEGGRERESWAVSLSPHTKEGRGREGERAGLVLCLLLQRREGGGKERELGWFPVSSYKGGKGKEGERAGLVPFLLLLGRGKGYREGAGSSANLSL